MTKIGMTGSRTGISDSAKKELLEILAKYTIEEIHHGDCVGADKIFHDIVAKYDPTIKKIVHPPNNDSMRAFCSGDIVLEPKGYLVRNKDIVNSSDMVIAFPSTKKEVLRSGTWSTIRYCKKVGKQVVIIYPE